MTVYGSTADHSAPLLLTMGDVLCEELEDLVHFSVHDLPARGYVVMEEIRRQGKLCDVTLKVKGTDPRGCSSPASQLTTGLGLRQPS